MTTRVRPFFLAALLVTVLALMALPRLERALRSQPDSAAHQERAYRTEQEWMVAQIAGTIASGARAARGASTPFPAPQVIVRTRSAPAFELLRVATFDISIDGGRLAPVAVREHVWSPDTYVELARALVGTPAVKRSHRDAADASSLLQTLTNPRVEVLLQEEGRVSALLAAEPFSADAHEEAALLVATLALRDTAETFTDLRPLLSRTTAHLALARAVAPEEPPGPCGQLAGIIVSILAGREDLATRDLDRWQPAGSPAAVAAWKAALRLRLPGDWRQAKVDASSSLLERLQYARTLAERVDSSRLLDFVDTMELEPIADWPRVVLEGGDSWEHFGVEAGHRFVEAGTVAEFQEIEQVWRHYHGGRPSEDVLVASLNDAGPAAYRAIDWPTWAFVLQRHLCAQLRATYIRLAGLGLADEIKSWRADATRRFGRLLLFPFVLRSAIADEATYKEASALGRAVFTAHIEAVTPRLSALLRAKPHFEARQEMFASDYAWFTPHVPTGTAFDLDHRTLVAGCPRPVPLAQVKLWAAQAPHDMWTAMSLAWLSAPGVPAFADVERALGPIPQYDLRAARHMFDYLQGTNTQFISLARMMCSLSADECGSLGGQLLMNGEEEKAASALDTYARKSRDTVKVSNDVGWLVGYYWDTARRPRATELAEAAGDTGSAQGLEILGNLRERQGRDEEARAIYAEIANRYEDDDWAMARFDVRQARRTGDAAWAKRAADAVPKIFPKGVETAEIGWLPAPPDDGLTFRTFGRRAARTGLRPTDIIVAVDGYRVHSVAQYQILAHGSFEPQMRFVVWRDARYQEIGAIVPQRFFGVTFANHPATQPPFTVR
jgi:hypothetical protein